MTQRNLPVREEIGDPSAKLTAFEPRPIDQILHIQLIPPPITGRAEGTTRELGANCIRFPGEWNFAEARL